MKYGILTYHNIPNIGAILQSQALCFYIRQLGYDCEIIDYTCDNIVRRELTFHSSTNLLKNWLLKRGWKKNLEKISKCNEYTKRLGIKSQLTYTRKSISTANDVYDAFISGSDMIWNLDINGNDFTYFLDFTDQNKKRISLGSSIGATWTDQECARLLPLLRRYDFISVREEDTCFALNKMGIPASHLSDPTLLIEPKQWIKYSKKTQLRDVLKIN